MNSRLFSGAEPVFGHVLVLAHSRAEAKMTFSALKSQVHVYRTENKIRLTSRFIACGLLLLPLELFRIAIGCKIVNSSMKFEFINKVAVSCTF